MSTTTYAVTSTGDTHWRHVSATTLTGAKRAATARYQQSVGGRLKVALVTLDPVGPGCDPVNDYEVVAVRDGFDDWRLPA